MATENEQLLSVQVTAALLIVEGLVANHPHPEKVRVVVDQLLGQIQAGLLASGEPVGSTKMLVALIDKVFAQP